MKFNGGKCFLAGTQILMSDTTAKYIEDIEVRTYPNPSDGIINISETLWESMVPRI